MLPFSKKKFGFKKIAFFKDINQISFFLRGEVLKAAGFTSDRRQCDIIAGVEG